MTKHRKTITATRLLRASIIFLLFLLTIVPFALGASKNRKLSEDLVGMDSRVRLASKRGGGGTGGLTANLVGMNFGTVDVGATQTLSAKISNTGRTTIHITSVSTIGNGFTATGLICPTS